MTLGDDRGQERPAIAASATGMQPPALVGALADVAIGQPLAVCAAVELFRRSRIDKFFFS